VELANACELYRDTGFFGQPANSVTSLAFVVCGVAIAADRKRGLHRRVPYTLLVIAVGAGSLVQHGPNPDWQAYAHDLPLATLLAYVAADAAADLLGREVSPAWWLGVPVAMLPVVAAGPTASSITQGGIAAVAIGLNLLRARRRPRLRRALIGSTLILGVGALVGTIGDRTSLCQPGVLLQGHAFWHLMAALALWWLAPAIGRRQSPVMSTVPEDVHLVRPDRFRAARPAHQAIPPPRHRRPTG
jgi:hypothetical protein